MKRIAYLLVVSLLVGCGGGGGGGGNVGTSSVAPTATTAGASSITLTSSTLNGSVNPNGTETSAWFEWGTNSNLQNPTITAKKSVGAGTTLQSVTESIEVLTQGTTHYYRVVAQNAGGIANGNIASFTTAMTSSHPTVSTNSATLVTGTGAQLNGTVIPNGLATDSWFEWGTSPTLASFTAITPQSIGSGVVSVSVNFSLSGLTTGQTYYYRAAAVNSLGTVTGSIASFTAGTVPSVTTQSATSVLDKSATLNGAVSPNGLSTTAWFEYGTNSSLTPHDNTAPQSLPSITGNFSINAPLTDLTPSGTYYFRVVAQNSVGSQFGLIESFTTFTKVSLWDQMVWDQDIWQ